MVIFVRATKNSGREVRKMGAAEVIIVGLVAISLGGCMVYSLIENKKSK